ncbi:MAG: PqqD family protein [Pyrinomonadaceae bacterium]
MRGPEALVKPLARKDNLIIRELPDEVLVYDLERDKAHCLNQTAALIWRHCDGRTSVSELARKLAHSSAAPIDERVVWFALKQLNKDQLLAAEVLPPAQMSGLTRRQMMRVLGVTAAVAIPLVTTIIAPTPAQASYGLPPGACCSASADCQSGICGAATAQCPNGVCA